MTTHYMTRDGRYLGSENKDTHTVIIPTDAPTLSRIWHGANLTPPGDIQRPNTVEARPDPATQPLYQGVRTLAAGTDFTSGAKIIDFWIERWSAGWTMASLSSRPLDLIRQEVPA